MDVQPAPSRTSTSAVSIIPAEYYPAEVQPSLYPVMPCIFPLVPQDHHEFYVQTGTMFKISFKSNEKSIKNPNQVIADDTLHCAPDKAICVYLGKKIYPHPFNGSYPRIAAYLKFSDDKKRDLTVTACERHATLLSNGQRFLSVISSESANVVNWYYDKNVRRAFVIEFDYPSTEEQPSISVKFGCKSSCFNRAVFELHVDLIYFDGTILPDKHLVKVSANPARDSLTVATAAVNEGFARAKGAFNFSAKPRARKLTNSSGGPEPSPKRTVPEPVQEDDPELPDNGIYTLTVFGLKDYKALLEQYSMIITRDKYKQIKRSSTQVPILNSQIPATAELDNWLEKAHLKKHKRTLNDNGIQTMKELLNVYHRRYFEDLNIPASEARVLHSSFIYWQTSYLSERFQHIETSSDD